MISVGLPEHQHLSAEDRSVGGVSGSPHALADDDDVRTLWRVLGLVERATDEGRHAEQRNEIRRRPSCRHALGLATSVRVGHARRAVVIERDAVDGLRVPLVREMHAGRRLRVVQRDRRHVMPDADQVVPVRDRAAGAAAPH